MGEVHDQAPSGAVSAKSKDLIPLVVCDLWEDFVGRNRTFEVCM